MRDIERGWEALKNVNNRGLGIKNKKCLYEGVILPTALYGAEAWGMRSAEGRKVNVLEIKCLRSLVGVPRMDRVRNGEVCRRAGIEREYRVEQIRVFKWFGHVERMDEYRMARRMLMAYVSVGRVRSRQRVGWMDVKMAFVQQRDDCGGCATIQGRKEGVESPGAHVDD